MKTHGISLIPHWLGAGRVIQSILVLLTAITILPEATAQTVNEPVSAAAYATELKSSHPASGRANTLSPLPASESGMQLFVLRRKNPLEMGLVIHNPTNKKLTFALLDAGKNVLYQSQTGTGWNAKLYSLRELPEGRYTLRLTSSAGQVTRTFVIEAPEKPRITF